MIELNKANIQALKDLYQIKEGIKKEVTIKNILEKNNKKTLLGRENKNQKCNKIKQILKNPETLGNKGVWAIFKK